MFLQYRIAIAAVVALVIVAAFSWLLVSRAGLQTDLATARATVSSCQDANNDFARQAQMANNELIKIKNESDERAKTAQQALNQATLDATSRKARADALTAIKPSLDLCKSADQLINNYFWGAK